MFDPKFIRLQELFGNLYCLEHLGGNTRRNIRELILENLPKEIKQKIPSIDFTTDPDNFIQVEVNVLTSDLNEVYASLKTAFPEWEWEISQQPNFSYIALRLDDDVIRGVPIFILEEA